MKTCADFRGVEVHYHFGKTIPLLPSAARSSGDVGVQQGKNLMDESECL